MECFERSTLEQEERMSELLDNFKTEMMGKLQEQDLKIARQSETILKLEETIAGQQKRIDDQNETIQMIATHPDLRYLLHAFRTGTMSHNLIGKFNTLTITDCC